MYIHKWIHNINYLYGFVEVHISITHIVHQFCHPPSELELSEHLSFKAPVTKQSFHGSESVRVTEWLLVLFSAGHRVRTIYPKFFPKAFSGRD